MSFSAIIFRTHSLPSFGNLVGLFPISYYIFSASLCGILVFFCLPRTQCNLFSVCLLIGLFLWVRSRRRSHVSALIDWEWGKQKKFNYKNTEISGSSWKKKNLRGGLMEQSSIVVSQSDQGYGIMKSAKRDRYVCFLDPCSGNTVKWSLSDLNSHRQKYHPSAGPVSCRRRGKQPTGKWPHKSGMAAEHARLRERGNLKRKLDKQENTYKRRLIKEAMATHGIQKEEDLSQEDLNDIKAAFAKYKSTRDERERATRSRIELALKLAEASDKVQGLLPESSNSSQGEPIILESSSKENDKELIVDADPIQIVIDPENRKKPRSKWIDEERPPSRSFVLQTPVHTNGVEAKIQQNALSVVEPQTGHDDDEESECEILFSSSSELVSNNLQKAYKPNLQPHKSVGSVSKAAARNHASGLQPTGTKSSSHGTLTLDVSKLETSAMWRCWRHFNLVDMNLNTSKEQLVDVVEKHLISQAKEHHMELRQDLAEIKRALEDLVRVFRDVEVIKV